MATTRIPAMISALPKGDALLSLKGCQKAVAKNPDNYKAWNNLGNFLDSTGKPNEAIMAYRRALKLKPRYYSAWFNLGQTLYKLGDKNGAIECFEQASDADRNCVALTWLSRIMVEAGDFNGAKDACARAEAVSSDRSEELSNIGVLHSNLGNFEKAEEFFRRSVAAWNENPISNLNLAIALLRNENFEEGWRYYDNREKPLAGFPEWDGSPLNGRTLLLRPEQGLGDTIQFIRFARQISGGRVLFDCPRIFQDFLLQQEGLGCELIMHGQTRPHVDVACCLMSLPSRLGVISADKIPAPIPYLKPSAAKVDAGYRNLGYRDNTKKKIGVVWQGNPRFGVDACVKADSRRSFNVKHFLGLRDVPGIQMYSFQLGYGSEQLEKNQGIVVLKDQIKDWSDTAALMYCMDLVISADTSPCHLAGAMGVPVWIAVPFEGCWRWMRRDDSPWYPTARLFRQTSMGDWEGVFHRIREALSDIPERHS